MATEKYAWKGKSSSTETIGSDVVYTTFATIPVREGAESLWFEFDTTADAALSAFKVEVRPHSNANWHAVANVSSDFTTNIQAPLEGVDTNPTSLAKSSSSMIWMGVKGLDSVRFSAKAGSSDAKVSDYYWQQR